MSATERLRKLLDECGVEWKRKRGRKHDGTEWHDQFGVYAEAVQEYSWDGFEHPEGKLLVRRGMGYLTPEQAIVATLGAGTCKVETTENWLPAERYHRCKHCGAFFAVLDASGDIPPRVCPNCGRRVVSE